MNRRRSAHRGLTASRIYPKNRRFYLFTAEPTLCPADGKPRKWHSLCKITEGEDRARELARKIIEHNRRSDHAGNFPERFRLYLGEMIASKDKTAPTMPERLKMYQDQIKFQRNMGETIIEAFSAFDIDQVLPVDIATFIDQWQGQRMGQLYHSRLSDFFRWCCRRGYRSENPVREVQVGKPASRARYITDIEFHAIRTALATGKNGKPNPSGQMVQCYVDLCYLLYQRTTEIRLLRWEDIDESSSLIRFKPTKTERSSGASVLVPLTPAIREVLSLARVAFSKSSLFVIHNQHGKPYTTSGIGTAWKRARDRAGVTDATLKDLRAKALTDAKRDGYAIEQISVGAAHTDTDMTEQYIKRRTTPTSELLLTLPPKQQS